MQELIQEYREWRKQEGLPWNAAFVPKSYDGLPDLEQKYWLAEQRARDFEKQTEWKKAVEVKKALPAARPRRRPLITKGKKPGTVIIAKSGEFGAPELELLVDGIGEALAPLVARIAELEAAASEPIYLGVWRDGMEVPRGKFVTWGGSVWHANEPTKDKPGEGPYTLAVKRGRDGKDGKDLKP
jgi:hypothetical protein